MNATVSFPVSIVGAPKTRSATLGVWAHERTSKDAAQSVFDARIQGHVVRVYDSAGADVTDLIPQRRLPRA